MPLNAYDIQNKKKRGSFKRPSVGHVSLPSSSLRHADRGNSVTIMPPESVSQRDEVGSGSITDRDSQRHAIVSVSTATAPAPASSSVVPPSSVSSSSSFSPLPGTLRPPSLSSTIPTGPVVTEAWSRSVVHPQDDYFLYESIRGAPPPMNYVQKMEVESRRRQVVQLSQHSKLHNSLHSLSLASDNSIQTEFSDEGNERRRSPSLESEGSRSSDCIPGRVRFFRQPIYRESNEVRSRSPSGSMDSYHHFSVFRVPSINAAMLSPNAEIAVTTHYPPIPTSVRPVTKNGDGVIQSVPVALPPVDSGTNSEATTPVEHAEDGEENTVPTPQGSHRCTSIFTAMMAMSSEELLANPIFCIMTEENCQRLILVEEEHVNRKSWREAFTARLEHASDEQEEHKTPPSTPSLESSDVNPILSMKEGMVPPPRACGKQSISEGLSTSVEAIQNKNKSSVPPRNSGTGQQFVLTSKPIVLQGPKDFRPSSRHSTSTGRIRVSGAMGSSRRGAPPLASSKEAARDQRVRSPRPTDVPLSSKMRHSRVDPHTIHAEASFRRTERMPTSGTNPPTAAVGSTFHRSGIVSKPTMPHSSSSFSKSSVSPSSSNAPVSMCVVSMETTSEEVYHEANNQETSPDATTIHCDDATLASPPPSSVLSMEKPTEIGILDPPLNDGNSLRVVDSAVSDTPKEDADELVSSETQEEKDTTAVITMRKMGEIPQFDVDAPKENATLAGDALPHVSLPGVSVDSGNAGSKDPESLPGSLPSAAVGSSTCVGSSQDSADGSHVPVGDSTATSLPRQATNCLSDAFSSFINASPVYGNELQDYMRFSENEFFSATNCSQRGGEYSVVDDRNNAGLGSFMDAFSSAHVEDAIEVRDADKWNRLYRRRYLSQLRQRARLVRLISQNSSDEEEDVEEDVDDLILGDNNYHQQNVQFVLDLFGELWSPEVNVDALRCVEDSPASESNSVEVGSGGQKKGASYYTMQALGVIFENPYQSEV